MTYPIEKQNKMERTMGEERYKILRQKRTEYPHTGTYNLHFEKAIVVVLVESTI
jgi:peptide-methionine (R)-S-oxide reductase